MIMKVRTRTKLDKYFLRLLMGQKQNLEINLQKVKSSETFYPAGDTTE